MRNIWRYLLVGVMAIGGAVCMPLSLYASENGEDGISYDQVASQEEQVKAQEVGVEGMVPVYGTDVADGVY